MKEIDQRVAAEKFAAYWQDRGYEKGESQAFWLSRLTLLNSVCGFRIIIMITTGSNDRIRLSSPY